MTGNKIGLKSRTNLPTKNTSHAQTDTVEQKLTREQEEVDKKSVNN